MKRYQMIFFSARALQTMTLSACTDSTMDTKTHSNGQKRQKKYLNKLNLFVLFHMSLQLTDWPGPEGWGSENIYSLSDFWWSNFFFGSRSLILYFEINCNATPTSTFLFWHAYKFSTEFFKWFECFVLA